MLLYFSFNKAPSLAQVTPPKFHEAAYSHFAYVYVLLASNN